MKETIIPGGATLWARQTVDSEIFTNKPDKWFKIWFYLVNKVSHKETNKYTRGECFLQYDWISGSINATPDQIKKCVSWLRKEGMVSTRRSTRGVWVKINKYDHFQRLDNYYYNVKAPDKAPEKHQRSTREAPRYNKNDKNDKNIILADESANNQKTNLKDLYKSFGLPEKVRVVNQWQDEAANAVKYFLDGNEKSGSIFKCFKDDQIKARTAFSDCKELEKNSALYFFKIYNGLKK